MVAPKPPVGRMAFADLYTSTAATPDDETSPKSNERPPTHNGGTVGIDLPFRVTKLNSGPRPLMVTDVLSPLSLLVVTPTSLDNASAIFLSANLPMSSAVIASTTPTFSLFIEIASIKLDLIPVVTTCANTKEVLMHGFMNVESLRLTIETKEAHYWSRSRKEIWHKGKTSGFVQKVKEIRIDDDQDSIWLSVDIGDGASCHVGYKSCFYRSVPLGKINNAREIKMKFEEKEKNFDPEKVYKGKQNPTKI